MEITWTCKSFDELTPRELYAVLRLRNEVFIVEQNCVYQDLDNKDFYAWHFMGWANQELIAYTRLLPQGISYDQASIGRVVNSPKFRGQGIGQQLMQQSINKLYALFGQQPIRIGAQLYLQKFYESFGFQAISPIYLEDNIEHIEMLMNPR